MTDPTPFPIPFCLVDERVLAPRLKITVKTLQAWRSTGGGPPFVKLGRAVRYNEADVRVWLESRTVKSTSAATIAEGAA